MDRTKTALERYPRWQPLNHYIERIELTIETDFPACVGNAKCLLEAVGKEICDWQDIDLGKSPKLNGVIKSAFKVLGLPGDDHLVQISTSLASIAQRIGQIRNNIDTSSHGKPLSELERAKEESLHIYTAEFLLGSADLVSSFLIETFERYRLEKATEEGPEMIYSDEDPFHISFDEEHGEVQFSDYAYQPSEVLFYVDRQAYKSERGTYYATINIEGEEE
jgi:hypothetical protein